MQQPHPNALLSHNGAAHTAERPLILALETDPAVAAQYAAVLGAAGYDVTVVGSALGAAARVRAARPLAVVLDVALPYVSGSRVMHQLKADPATAGVPVVVVSAVTDLLGPQDRAAAAAVVAKPFDPAALVATLAGAIAAGV